MPTNELDGFDRWLVGRKSWCAVHAQAREALDRQYRTTGRFAQGHFGLLRDRFFLLGGHAHDGKIAIDREIGTQFLHILAQRDTLGDQQELTRACEAIRGIARDRRFVARVTNDWHCAVGLGLPHLSEFGLLLHPTLGVPYLPGAAGKGLLRHALTEGWVTVAGFEDAGADTVSSWLGSADVQGLVAVFDALPCKPVSIATDVLTPHTGDWPGWGGDQVPDDELWRYLPADWHNPVPLCFHVARGMTLQLAVVPTVAALAADRKRAGDLAASLLGALSAALAVLGAGARTSRGYGRFRPEI